MEQQLVAMHQDEPTCEAAEDALEALIPPNTENEEANPGGEGHHDPNGPPCDDAVGDSEGNDASDEEVVWEFKDCEVAFECEAKASSSKELCIGTVPSGSIKTMPAFMFLDQIGLAEVPNVTGVGMGVHTTTQCWQVRYPCESGQQSAGRKWGTLKNKGYVPPLPCFA